MAWERLGPCHLHAAVATTLLEMYTAQGADDSQMLRLLQELATELAVALALVPIPAAAPLQLTFF